MAAVVEIQTVRGFHSLGGVKDEEITTHLNTAIRDFARTVFADEHDEIEAICCQTIYYVIPILWAKGMNNFAGYETVYSSASDIEKLQKSWKARADAAVNRGTTATPASGKLRFGAV